MIIQCSKKGCKNLVQRQYPILNAECFDCKVKRKSNYSHGKYKPSTTKEDRKKQAIKDLEEWKDTHGPGRASKS